MNWKIEGKNASDKTGALTVIGQTTEDDARAHVKANYPTFKVEKVAPLDGNLNPITRAEAKELAEPVAAETATTKPDKSGK